MKHSIYLLVLLTMLMARNSSAQITISPAIGLHTNYGKDLLMTNLVQWNPKKRLALAAHTSFNINNPFKRTFNGIKTNYDYSINQKFGIGTTFYAKKSTSTFLLMAGVKYSAFKESLTTPDNKAVSSTINSTTPDYGLMYSFTKGNRNTFFSFRMYVPLYPWPIKGSDINHIDGNINNIALELGVGIKIK